MRYSKDFGESYRKRTLARMSKKKKKVYCCLLAFFFLAIALWTNYICQVAYFCGLVVFSMLIALIDD